MVQHSMQNPSQYVVEQRDQHDIFRQYIFDPLIKEYGQLDAVPWSAYSDKISAMKSSIETEIEQLPPQLAALKESFPKLVNIFNSKTEKLLHFTLELVKDAENTHNDLHQRTDEMEALQESLAPIRTAVVALHRKRLYLECAVEMEERCATVRRLIEDESNFREGLGAYMALLAFATTAVDGRFKQLKKVLTTRIEYFSKSFRQHGTMALNTALKAIEWPKVLAEDSFSREKENLDKIRDTFTQLVEVQLSLFKQEVGDKDDTDLNEPLWAMECLLDPLIRRFKYHFEGTRRTNRIDKPEHFFDFAVDTVWDHSAFLHHVIEPALEKTGISVCNTQSHFIRGFVHEIRAKLRATMPVILESESLLCHTMDQILKFENTIEQDFGYHSIARNTVFANHWPRCISIITNKKEWLEKWISVEWKYAMEYLREIVEAPDAWMFPVESIVNSPMVVADINNESALGMHVSWDEIQAQEFHVTSSALAFLRLFRAIRDRFECISSDEKKLLFVSNLQKPLIQQYYLATGQMAKKQRMFKRGVTHPESEEWKVYFGCINSCTYVSYALEECMEESLYVDLQLEAKKQSTSEYSTELNPLSVYTQNAKKVMNSALTTVRDHTSSATELSREKISNVLANVAQSEESEAVKRAVLGPSAMIGPAAALSAAFSTMRSVLNHGRAENNDEESSNVQTDQCEESGATMDLAQVGEAVDELESTSQSSSPLQSPSRSGTNSSSILKVEECLVNAAEEMLEDYGNVGTGLFDREMSMFRTLAEAMAGDMAEAIVHTFIIESGHRYRQSVSQFAHIEQGDTGVHTVICRDISPALGSGVGLLFDQMSSAKRHMNDKVFPSFWKLIAKQLDSFLFDSIFVSYFLPGSGPDIPKSSSSFLFEEVLLGHRKFSISGVEQLAFDMESIYSCFSSFTSNTSRFFPMMWEACTLLQLDSDKRNILLDVFAGSKHDESSSQEYEQLSSMLEQFGIQEISTQQSFAILKLIV